jgi:hypothetical protein
MSSNLKQNPDGSTGLEGDDKDAGEFINASTEWTASSVGKVFFVAPRKMVVQVATARVEVAGTDGSAVTAVIKKVASGTALASGTTIHSGTINLKGTAATNQSLTLSSTTSTVTLNAGDALAIAFTGTLTSATGVASVGMCPA